MDKLQQNGQLNVNDQLVSGNGRVRLVLQGDGNLVLYRTDDGRALWASNTAGKPVASTVMQGDGNFVAYGSGGHPYWASNTGGHSGSWLILQDDGNLVIYDGASNKALWASSTVQHFGPAFVPGFTPKTRAPLFHNGPWPTGTSLSISILGLPPVDINATQMGLCGGMSFLTRDIFESGTPQLRGRQANAIPLALAQHIMSRLVQSFAGPAVVNRWLALTQAFDHDTIVWGAGAFHQSVNEVPGIIGDIDSGMLCPIGVVLVRSYAPWDVFQNHVVLVWGYERHGDMLTLHTYDCNNEDRDDITIQLDIGSPTPAKPIITNGTESPSAPGQIRAFFRLPYTHADPSPAYIDDASVSASVLPPTATTASATVPVRLSATNTGSTTWTPGSAYRLGSQAPQDNSTWGTNRVDLQLASVDPGQTAPFQFNAVAPAVAGSYGFSWQMVRDSVHWFGHASPNVAIAVGSTTGACKELHRRHAGLAAQLKAVRADIAAIDWSDPRTARMEGAALNRLAMALVAQIEAVTRQQIASGCAAG